MLGNKYMGTKVFQSDLSPFQLFTQLTSVVSAGGIFQGENFPWVRNFSGDELFKRIHNTGWICQNSYTKFFLFVLLYLSRIDFACGGVKGIRDKFSPGLTCLEDLSVGRDGFFLSPFHLYNKHDIKGIIQKIWLWCGVCTSLITTLIILRAFPIYKILIEDADWICVSPYLLLQLKIAKLGRSIKTLKAVMFLSE